MEDFTDTDPRVMKVWLAMLRAKTPGERILMASNSATSPCAQPNPVFARDIPRLPNAKFSCDPQHSACRAIS